jgi:hypothetical protein
MIAAFKKFSEHLLKNMKEHGAKGILMTTRDAGVEIRKNLVQKMNIIKGENIYEKEWDILILLDCARVDMMEEVADDYQFLTQIEDHPTLGTSSVEWMQTTFTGEYTKEMGNTVYITANPNSDECLSSRGFQHLEEVWRDGWDSDIGTIPARSVTDRAIAFHRELNPQRMIIHYMQPHPPFVPRSDIEVTDVSKPDMEKEKMNVAELHNDAGYTFDQLWEAHMQNLEYVLNDVELLLSNIDADRVIISADHGQALGESGVWGHPRSISLDVVRRVPWCVTSASNTDEYDPDFEMSYTSSISSELVEERLEYLGYK